MKSIGRLWCSVLIVLCSVIFIDIISGKVLNLMLSQISVKTAIGKTYFALNEINMPVVIVGSSRASHHYVTQQIEDSLGLNTYNVGRDGCYFGYNISIINSILDRYAPKIIIWEFPDNSLFVDSDDPLESLYPYYNDNIQVTKIIDSLANSNLSLYLKSNLYRYNSTILRVILRWLDRNQISDINKGYEPLPPKKWITEKEINTESICNHNKLNQQKIDLLKETLKKAQEMDVQMILVKSPIYSYSKIENQILTKSELSKVLTSYGAYYQDNTFVDGISQNNEYFNDNIHLNSIGAELYTKMFIEQIKDLHQ